MANKLKFRPMEQNMNLETHFQVYIPAIKFCWLLFSELDNFKPAFRAADLK